MRLSYQEAVIGFSNDLTDPASKSVPVALLIVGTLEAAECFAALVVRKPEGLDPLSSLVMRDVPALVQRYVDGALSHLTDGAPPGEILFAVHHALRNSLHVQSIGEMQERELQGPGSVEREVVGLLVERFEEIVRAGNAEQGPRRPKAPTLQPTKLWPLAVEDRSGARA